MASFVSDPAPAAAPRRVGPQENAPVGLPANWRALRKIDVHNHVFGLAFRPNANWAEVESLVEAEAVGDVSLKGISRPVKVFNLLRIKA